MKLEKGTIAVKDPNWEARPLEDFKYKPEEVPEVILPEYDENGVTIYRDMPPRLFHHFCQVRPARFVPYQCPPVRGVKVRDLGQIKYKTFNPWYYEIEEKEVDGATVKVLTWYENDCTEHPPEYGPVQVTRKPEKAEKAPEPKEAPVEPPPPPAKPVAPPKTPQQFMAQKKREAAEIIGEEAVRELELGYRAEVKQTRGHLAKKKCYEFIEGLEKAVAAIQAKGKEESEANEE